MKRCCLLALLTAMAALAQAEEPARVLVLFSNDRLLPADQRFDEGMRRALEPQGQQTSVALFGEFLDAIHFSGPEHEAAMEQYLSERYRDTRPEVLVAMGPQALEFFLARRDTLFPGAPLIFGGVTREQLARNKDLRGVAGLPMELTMTSAVEALLAMRPQTKEIVLVSGKSDFDRSLRDTALRQCAPFAARVKITDCPKLPLPELKSSFSRLPPEAAVFFLCYFQSPTGETYTPARVAAEIAAASAVPVMGTYDTYFGSGLLGVSATPFEGEGVVVGHLIRRVLAGEKVENIGVLPPSLPRLILDARQMQRWGIQSVPAGAEVRLRTPTLWEEHRSDDDLDRGGCGLASRLDRRSARPARVASAAGARSHRTPR